MINRKKKKNAYYLTLYYEKNTHAKKVDYVTLNELRFTYFTDPKLRRGNND